MFLRTYRFSFFFLKMQHKRQLKDVMKSRKTLSFFISTLVMHYYWFVFSSLIIILLIRNKNDCAFASSSDSNKASFINSSDRSSFSVLPSWSLLRRVFAPTNTSLEHSTTSKSAAETSTTRFLDSDLDFLQFASVNEDVVTDRNTSSISPPTHEPYQEPPDASVFDSSTLVSTATDQQRLQPQGVEYTSNDKEQRRAAFGLKEEDEEQEITTMPSSEDQEEEMPPSEYYYEEEGEYDDDDDEDDDEDWKRLPPKVPYRKDEEDDSLEDQYEMLNTATNDATTTTTTKDNAVAIANNEPPAGTINIYKSNDGSSRSTSLNKDDKTEQKLLQVLLQSNNQTLRHIRKTASRMTGMTGFFSGKQNRRTLVQSNLNNNVDPSIMEIPLGDDELGMIRRRIAAIETARAAVVNMEEEIRRRSGTTGSTDAEQKLGPIRWLAVKRRALLSTNKRQQQQQQTRKIDENSNNNSQQPQTLSEQEGIALFREYPAVLDAVASAEAEAQKARTLAAQAEEERRRARVSEINRQIEMAKGYMFDLQSEKDDLLRRPNPFFNHTKGLVKSPTKREFNFPSQELVDEYIEQLVSSGRLIMLNHTFLWKEAVAEDFDEDDSIAEDELFAAPFSDARRQMDSGRRRGSTGRRSNSVLPMSSSLSSNNGAERRSNSNGGGSWLLRQSIGKGESLGEKIGQVIETSTYKAVCKSVMSVLARSISALHGLSVLNHSDVRLFMESTPDLPVGDFLFHGGDTSYAEETIRRAIRRSGSTSNSNRKKVRTDTASSFLQRDAVVETLLSHCQISAPLLNLFPLPWQREFLANIVTLVIAVVSDFASGLRIQLLGHFLTFSLEPITESDLLEQMESNYHSFNNHRAREAEFEDAVTATATDLSEQLVFLDKWHERALGSGMLRAQMANLISRIVLTVVDDMLRGTEINLWTKQASGPRVMAGLEYRA